MKTSNENRWAFKVLAGNYISEEDLEGLGISADWHLYLSPTEPPSAAQCNQLMNAYDLSACPCCGGRATIIGTLKTCEWSAICTMCGLETAHMMQPKDAASNWNKRHAPDEGPAGIKTTEPNQMDAMLTDKPQNATIVPCDVCRQPNRIGHDCTPPESGGQGEDRFGQLVTKLIHLPRYFNAMPETKWPGWVMEPHKDGEWVQFSAISTAILDTPAHPPAQASGAVTEAKYAELL